MAHSHWSRTGEEWPFAELSYPVGSHEVAKTLIPKCFVEKDGVEICEPSFFLSWPPNLFAFTSSYLLATASYGQISADDFWNLAHFEGHPIKVERMAEEWRKQLNSWSEADITFLSTLDVGAWRQRAELSPWLKEAWEIFTSKMQPSPTADTFDLWDEDHRAVVQNLISLHAAADLVCADWGRPGQSSACRNKANDLLLEFGTMATIHPSRGRVLPKSHTPRVGITLRSLSNNLAFHRSSVKVGWNFVESLRQLGTSSDDLATTNSGDIVNVLLCPWPRIVKASDFRPTPDPQDDDVGLFSYEPAGDLSEALQHDLPDVLKAAIAEAEDVDLVVFPESYIDVSDLDTLERILLNSERGPRTYVAGVRSNNRNRVVFGVLGSDGWKRIERDKHHRWLLESSQIRKYQLGSRLHPSRRWWENIPIDRREVEFVGVGRNLTICPLVCEDLARQGEAAALMRDVGPTLIVVILLDGPQESQRWAGRYAGVLGDDPGSAVVTLTSAGMVRRVRGNARALAACVGFWNDRNGVPTEIMLEGDSKAILLSLAATKDEEVTLDHRRAKQNKITLSLSGVTQIHTERRSISE